MILKISKIGIISKEGDSTAKDWAKKTAKLLLENGFGVTSFPNLRMKGVDHVPSVRDIGKSKIDLVITFSGDGTILKLLRSLDRYYSLPLRERWRPRNTRRNETRRH